MHPIQSHLHSDSFSDLCFLAEVLKDKSIIGLGEASHGTEEFYAQKGRIVQYLVQELNYRILAIEATTEKVELLNQYVNDESGDLKSILKKSGLYNFRVMYDLLVWLKDFNKNRINGDKVSLIGFDNEAFWYDPTTTDEGMAELFSEKYVGKILKQFSGHITCISQKIKL